MRPHGEETSARSVRDSRPLNNAVLAVLAVLGALLGCNQNPPGAPGDPYGAPQSPSAAYMADLQRQANAESRLAYEQRRQLEYMRVQQEKANAQMLALQNQKQAAANPEAAARDGQLASQAVDAIQRYDELGRRASSLDQSNRSLHSELAQVQQRVQLLEDQNRLMRQRLQETSEQLTTAMQTSEDATRKYQSLLTSTQRRSGASITANNSYRRNLTAVTIQGLDVRQDGDLVRIELPSDQLFEPDGATIRPDAGALIDQAANVVLKHYPRQVVGIEAHTDNSPVGPRGWRSSHQLTAAQAMSVFEAMSDRQRILTGQMFVLGHGDNYPVTSNSTVAGQARNRRVEIVVYPETTGRLQ